MIAIFVPGVPCTSNNKESKKSWQRIIEEATSELPELTAACKIRIKFQLASEAYVTGGKFGPDLDNLLKPVLDALKRTVLKHQGDECVVDLHATKQPASTDNEAGIRLEIEELGSHE